MKNILTTSAKECFSSKVGYDVDPKHTKYANHKFTMLYLSLQVLTIVIAVACWKGLFSFLDECNTASFVGFISAMAMAISMVIPIILFFLFLCGFSGEDEIINMIKFKKILKDNNNSLIFVDLCNTSSAVIDDIFNSVNNKGCSVNNYNSYDELEEVIFEAYDKFTNISKEEWEKTFGSYEDTFKPIALAYLHQMYELLHYNEKDKTLIYRGIDRRCEEMFAFLFEGKPLGDLDNLRKCCAKIEKLHNEKENYEKLFNEKKDELINKIKEGTY